MDDILELKMDDLDAVSGGAAGGEAQNSGWFKSETGTCLDIRVDWSVVKGSLGEKTLEVVVSSQSYSLNSIELENGVELHVGSDIYRSNSAAVSYSGSSIILSPLASFSIPNLSGPVKLTAIWRFNGTYSNVALPEIQAVGMATV